ncbi:MAG: MBL fold metallo-hydrolase RNA specificity domain-containing protein, partial [Verrucomicrobiota bacterium]
MSPVEVSTKPLQLPALDLFLDPHYPKPFAFVSHAHADHFARHDTILCSPQTAHLLHKRFNVASSRLQPLAFNSPLEHHGHLLRLLPAGHIFGSAMLHVTRTDGHATLLYTGDYKLRESLTADTAQLLQADTLIMETTFGLPHYVFPRRSKIESDILNFVHATLDDGDTPILLGYSLGKAQEALAILHEHNLPTLAHKNVHQMSQACFDAGSPFPVPELFTGPVPPGHTLVAPPNAVRSKQIRALKNRRLAMLSGWALNPGAQYRYQTDAAFPLSDHADYPELLETVKRVQPQSIITIHGSTREFATTLRQHGYDAWSIQGDDQIELDFQQPESSTTPPQKKLPQPKTEISQLSDLIEAIASASSRLRKITLLADHLRELPDPLLTHTTAFLSHRLLPDNQPLALGSALIRQALLQATNAPLARYRQISNQTADSARTTRLLLEQIPIFNPSTSLSTLHELAQLFHQIASTTGSLDKTTLLAHTLTRLHPRDAELLIKLLTGDLRAG